MLFTHATQLLMLYNTEIWKSHLDLFSLISRKQMFSETPLVLITALSLRVASLQVWTQDSSSQEFLGPGWGGSGVL